MCHPHVVVGACLATLAVVLCGCGGGQPPPSRRKSTVFVFRHCLRSTPNDGIEGTLGFEYYNNYSAQPWPAFDVPAYHCLERGADIAEGTGRWIRGQADNFHNLPSPVRMLADDCERDIVTGRALLKGLGLEADASTFSINAAPFHNANISGACPTISAAEEAAAIEKQLRAIPMEDHVGEFSELLAKVYSATGTGAAGNWTDSPCKVLNASGILDGSCNAASDFTERFLMEWGGKMQFAWGRIKPEDLPRLLRLHSWFRQVTCAVPTLVAQKEASIVRGVLSSLDLPGTTMFVGHDTQLNALNGAFGFSWEPEPFPPNATLPGSFLRFDRDGDHVSVSYTYISNFTDSTGDAMTTTPVMWPNRASTDKTSFSQLKEIAEKSSIEACANLLLPHSNTHAGSRSARTGVVV